MYIFRNSFSQSPMTLNNLPRTRFPWVNSKRKDKLVFKLFETVFASGKHWGLYVQYQNITDDSKWL